MKTNEETRERNYLTHREVDSIIKAIRKHSRYPARDQLLILMLFRHGLRINEAVSLTWKAFDLYENTFYIQKGGDMFDGICHPLSSEVIRLAAALKKKTRYLGSYVFLSQRDAPMATQTAHSIIRTMSKKAGIPFYVNSSMFRGGCIRHLVERGVDLITIQRYLGLKTFRAVVKYLPEDGKCFRRSLWEGC